MKKSEITVGMEVVVNDQPDATVYKVESIAGFAVSLSVNGKLVDWMDVCWLQKPSAKQLAFNTAKWMEE